MTVPPPSDRNARGDGGRRSRRCEHTPRALRRVNSPAAGHRSGRAPNDVAARTRVYRSPASPNWATNTARIVRRRLLSTRVRARRRGGGMNRAVAAWWSREPRPAPDSVPGLPLRDGPNGGGRVQGPHTPSACTYKARHTKSGWGAEPNAHRPPQACGHERSPVPGRASCACASPAVTWVCGSRVWRVAQASARCCWATAWTCPCSQRTSSRGGSGRAYR